MKRNKMARRLAALATAVCLMVCTAGTLAAGSAFAEIDLPDVDVETGFVIISGALTAEQTKGVTLMVFVPGTDTNGILNTPSVLEEKLYYTDTVQSFEDGVFEFEFDMTKGPNDTQGETGAYPFILACGDIRTGTVDYTNRNDVLDVLRAIAAVESAEALQEMFTKETAVKLGMNGDLADDAQKKLTGEAAEAVYGAIVNADPAIDGEDMASANRIARLFEGPAAIAVLQSAQEAAELQGYVGKYNKYYGFAMGDGSNYAKINLAANRTIVYQVLAAEGDLSDLAAAQASFDKAALVGYVNDITAPGTMQAVLRENAATLGIDLTAYNALSSDNKRANVINDLMKLTMTSSAEIATQFAAKVQEYAAKPDNSGSITTTPPQSGSGGGHGGGGGGSWTGLPADPGTSTTPGSGTNTENTTVFHDLSGSEWAQEPILALYYRGVVNGKSDGVFEPESSVTRAEFVKMIVNALELTTENQPAEFDDVTPGDWFYDVVRTAAACGIVNGDGAGFNPNANITREDMAVIIVRAAQYANVGLSGGTSAAFTDAASISSYAAEAVSKMQANGIVNGMEDGSFQPKQNATRAQACKMLYELLKI